MKTLTCCGLALFACLAAIPAIAAEDDAVAAIFVYGRARPWTASGFAVGDGTYIVTTVDAVTEPSKEGKRTPVPYAVVVSRWTGEAYPAAVVATDDQIAAAVLKIAAPAVPPVAVAGEAAFARAPKATLGELLSGEEVGGRFPTEIYGLDAERKPPKFTVSNWRAANACLTEIKGRNWLFLSRVNPPEKAPKAALVAKPGVGALGMYIGRVIVEAGAKPATFYRVLPATDLRAFLIKSGVPGKTLAEPPSIGLKAADAEASFQATCLALAASAVGAPSDLENAAAAAKLRPRNATVQMLLATALARHGKLDEALKATNTALEIDPKLPDGKLNRATMLAAAGKTADAEQEFRKLMQDNPKDPRPVLALSELLAAKDATLDEALKLGREAVRLAPDDLGARLALARILKKKKDYDAAIAELQSVLKTAPMWGAARVALGATYEAAGKPDLAEAEYRKLVDLEPGNPDAHLNLIEFLVSAGKKDDARKAIEEMRKIKLQPEALEALKKLEERLQSGQ